MNAIDTKHNLSTEGFYQLIAKLEAALKSAGIPCQGRARIAIFPLLESTEQKYILNRLAEYVEIIETTKGRPSDANFDKQFIWNSFNKLGIHLNDDLIKLYDDDIVVEFYTLEGLQIFRNFNFFKVCSYSLEEIFTRKWYDLFERQNEDVQFLLKYLKLIQDEILTSAISPDIPVHIIVERDSIERNVIEYKMKHLVPLKHKMSSEKIIGCMEAARVLSTLNDRNGVPYEAS